MPYADDELGSTIDGVAGWKASHSPKPGVKGGGGDRREDKGTGERMGIEAVTSPFNATFRPCSIGDSSSAKRGALGEGSRSSSDPDSSPFSSVVGDNRNALDTSTFERLADAHAIFFFIDEDVDDATDRAGVCGSEIFDGIGRKARLWELAVDLASVSAVEGSVAFVRCL